MKKIDLLITGLVITLTILCLIIGMLKELNKIPETKQEQTTTYKLSVEILTVRKMSR